MEKWDELTSFPREMALALLEGQKLAKDLVNMVLPYEKKISSITMSQFAQKDGSYCLRLTVHYRHEWLPHRMEIKLDDDVFSFKECKVVFINDSFCTIDVDVKEYRGCVHFLLEKKELFDTDATIASERRDQV